MFRFIFRMSNGKKYIINNVKEGFENAIWEQLDAYCKMFETKTKKVISVRQEEVK